MSAELGYSLITIAAVDTTLAESRFADFGPYVPAIDDQGKVAFQAALSRGGAGIYAGQGGPLSCLADTHDGVIADVISHPDFNAAGDVCCYARLGSGEDALLRFRRGQPQVLARSGDGWLRIGPLGPMLDAAGAVAFRADAAAGASGVYLAEATDQGRIRVLAEARDGLRGFEGLPLIGQGGTLVFRAEADDGSQLICTAEGGPSRILVRSGERFASLGRFPCLDPDGRVIFSASYIGGSGIFALQDGWTIPLFETDKAFESLRGALFAHDRLVYFATPRGGQLGLFTGPDPLADRLLGIDDPLFDSRVTDFALNPVSINRAGQLAIRVALADGRQLILRADPHA